MCIIDLCSGSKYSTSNFSNIRDAISYFSEEVPTVHQTFAARKNLADAEQTFIKLGVNITFDSSHTIPDINSNPVIHTSRYFQFTHKECQYITYIVDKLQGKNYNESAQFFGNTSCEVYNSYFEGAGQITNLGINNFGYLQAFVEKSQACNVSLPLSYNMYDSGNALMACQVKAQMSEDFNLTNCYENISNAMELAAILVDDGSHQL